MKVAYTSDLKLTVDKAKKEAAKQYPELETDLKPIRTKEELESLLIDRGYVVYIDVDIIAEESAIFIANEQSVSQDVDGRLDDAYCEPELPPILVTQEELDSMDFCEAPEPEPVPTVSAIELAKFEADIADIIRKQDGGLSEGKNIGDIDPDSAIGKITNCVGEMRRITAELNVLLDRETKRRETVINMEQLLYHYRIMGEYYQTKVDTLDGLIDTFTVPIREKRKIEEVDIPKIDQDIALKQEELNTYTGSLLAGVQRPTPQETSLNNAIAALQQQKTELNDRTVEITEQIKLAKEGTWSFDFDNLQNASLSNRRNALLSELNSLGAGTAFGDISNFSTNVTLVRQEGGSAEDTTFSLEIRHETIDQDRIFLGQDMSFAKTGGVVTINNYAIGDPGGVLYTQLYNIWDDIELFFTRSERGLTTDKNQQDPTLLDTGMQAINGSFIQNLSTYEKFYTNFATIHADKTQLIKDTIIEPTLNAARGSLKPLAVKEVQLLLSFGKVFEILPEDRDPDGEGQRLDDIISAVRNNASEYLAKLDACQGAYDYAIQSHTQILQDIEKKKSEYSTVKCVAGAPTNDPEPTNPPGSDPLGVETMGNEDPNNPNFTKFCYWLKFSAMATSVNILPIPGPGGFKYWPIGFTVPGPNGITKIPLPIVWIPLAVIAMPAGVFVVFIGQCGVCPSPFVLYLGSDGAKQFIASLRPTDSFGTDASAGTFKPRSKGGIAVTAKVKDLINGISVPGIETKMPPEFKPILNADTSDSIILDIKEKIVRKINKLTLPDMSKIQGLNPNATIAEKREAFKQTVEQWIDGLKVPSLKIPKNADTVNPKPTPVSEIIDQLKFSIDMDLPVIAPPTDMIDLKSKLMDQIDALNINELPNIPPITIPPLTGDPAKVAEFEVKVKDAMKLMMSKSVDKLTPKSLGIVAVASTGISFLNPYVCRQTPGKFSLPSVPGLTNALTTIKGAAVGAVDAINAGIITDIAKKLSGPGSLTIDTPQLKNILKEVADVGVPDVKVPNPSNLSIKDMMQSAAKSVASLQLPSLPAVGSIPKPRVSIPGSLLKDAVKEFTMNTLDALDIDLLPDFSTMSAVDVKSIAVDLVEKSLTPIAETVQPFINIINTFKSAQDMSFGEMLGVKKTSIDTSSVEVLPPDLLTVAMNTMSRLAIIPYPSVCIAPQAATALHPVLVQDDLPPWERLSIRNFMFVSFLDQFCVQGKKGGGLFENP